MTQSMTGYGQGHWQGEGLAVFVEVSAVNARHFRLHPRLPHDLAAAERDLAKLIRKRLARGSVNLFVKVELTGAQAARPINQDALASYVRQLRQVGRELDVPVTFTADALAALPGVLASDEFSSADHEALVGHVTDALERALDELSHMREAEGAHLRQELLRHNDAVERVVGQLERGLPDALDLYAQRLTTRVNRLLERSDITVSAQDLAREVAVHAERSSVAEEIARLRSHVEQLRHALDRGGPVGRRLEFLAQEMAREVNTMGAKIADVALAALVVELHAQVDKIREQVVNVE